MTRRLGRLGKNIAVLAAYSVVVFALSIWLTGATPFQSATMLALAIALGAVFRISQLLFSKLFPNTVRKYEEEQQNRTFVGDGDE
jgi:hypothetical protein